MKVESELHADRVRSAWGGGFFTEQQDKINLHKDKKRRGEENRGEDGERSCPRPSTRRITERNQNTERRFIPKNNRNSSELRISCNCVQFKSLRMILKNSAPVFNETELMKTKDVIQIRICFKASAPSAPSVPSTLSAPSMSCSVNPSNAV